MRSDAYIHSYAWLIIPVSSFLFCLFFTFLFTITRPLIQFLHHLPTISISFSLLHPGANEFWMWSVWGPKLLPYCRLSSWVLPWCAKCLSWILNKPQDHLRASWSTALLLSRCYSARGLRAPSGWMGFESIVSWAKVEIIGTGGLSVWSCFILPLVMIKFFFSVF